DLILQALSLTVVQEIALPTTVAVTSDANPGSVVGGMLTLTAMVASSPPGQGTPTGTVTFLVDDSVSLAAETLNSGGVATFTTNTPHLAAGPPTITVRYGGDSSSTSSSGELVIPAARQDPPPTHLAQVASAFTHSAEYFANVIVIPAYAHYLGRGPDPAGL